MRIVVGHSRRNEMNKNKIDVEDISCADCGEDIDNHFVEGKWLCPGCTQKIIDNLKQEV